jgi:toxin-antitoxin system PIN domain toxin
MRLHDVNVLIYAHRPESESHEAYRQLIADDISGEQAYAVSDVVVNGFLRIATDKRIYRTPTPLSLALAFAEQVRHQPTAVTVAPGARHWSIVTRLCHEVGAGGRDFPDVFLAALAIEHGCELVTADKGFKRFRGLRVAEV